MRPKNFDGTQELDLSPKTDINFNDDFQLEQELDIGDQSSAVDNATEFTSGASIGFGSGDTGEFDLSSVEIADKEIEDSLFPNNTKTESVPQVQIQAMKENLSAAPMHSYTPASERASFVSDEESTRLQATIRQMRDEREELLSQLKTMKSEVKEVEQDNLTLKAALDEAKLEVSILRKRHLVEMEDIKYHLNINDEKRAMAEERARLAEGKREKLEQKVRIDFNQVKQREKELETKLEMLSIDVDSQIHSRDQKILELRRKIDALENVSIKEQKSQDDKRKLEDKLNKIMKTLRHSIKNLEDDIDQATEDGQDERRDTHRSGKA